MTINTTLSAAEIAALAKERGITITRLCREADVRPATWYRWLSGGGDINLSTYQRLVAAVSADD